VIPIRIESLPSVLVFFPCPLKGELRGLLKKPPALSLSPVALLEDPPTAAPPPSRGHLNRIDYPLVEVQPCGRHLHPGARSGIKRGVVQAGSKVDEIARTDMVAYVVEVKAGEANKDVVIIKVDVTNPADGGEPWGTTAIEVGGATTSASYSY
jgi:hypothetical protein